MNRGFSIAIFQIMTVLMIGVYSGFDNFKDIETGCLSPSILGISPDNNYIYVTCVNTFQVFDLTGKMIFKDDTTHLAPIVGVYWIKAKSGPITADSIGRVILWTTMFQPFHVISFPTQISTFDSFIDQYGTNRIVVGFHSDSQVQELVLKQTNQYVLFSYNFAQPPLKLVASRQGKYICALGEDKLITCFESLTQNQFFFQTKTQSMAASSTHQKLIGVQADAQLTSFEIDLQKKQFKSIKLFHPSGPLGLSFINYCPDFALLIGGVGKQLYVYGDEDLSGLPKQVIGSFEKDIKIGICKPSLIVGIDEGGLIKVGKEIISYEWSFPFLVYIIPSTIILAIGFYSSRSFMKTHLFNYWKSKQIFSELIALLLAFSIFAIRYFNKLDETESKKNKFIDSMPEVILFIGVIVSLHGSANNLIESSNSFNQLQKICGLSNTQQFLSRLAFNSLHLLIITALTFLIFFIITTNSDDKDLAQFWNSQNFSIVVVYFYFSFESLMAISLAFSSIFEVYANASQAMIIFLLASYYLAKLSIDLMKSEFYNAIYESIIQILYTINPIFIFNFNFSIFSGNLRHMDYFGMQKGILFLIAQCIAYYYIWISRRETGTNITKRKDIEHEQPEDENIKQLLLYQLHNEEEDHLEVQLNQILIIVGENGSGKSTILKDMLGIKNSNGFNFGKIQMNVAELTIGCCLQTNTYYPDLNIIDHLRLFCAIRKMNAQQSELQIKQIVNEFYLDAEIQKPVKFLSGGNLRKMCIGCALIGSPSLIALDEPSVGLDPISKKNLWKILKDRKNKGATIIIATSDLLEAQQLGERFCIMKLQRPYQILKNQTEISWYLKNIYSMKLTFKIQKECIQMVEIFKEALEKQFQKLPIEMYLGKISIFFEFERNSMELIEHIFKIAEKCDCKFSLKYLSGKEKINQKSSHITLKRQKLDEKLVNQENEPNEAEINQSSQNDDVDEIFNGDLQFLKRLDEEERDHLTQMVHKYCYNYDSSRSSVSKSVGMISRSVMLNSLFFVIIPAILTLNDQRKDCNSLTLFKDQCFDHNNKIDYDFRVNLSTSILYFFASSLFLWYFNIREKQNHLRSISESIGLSIRSYWQINFQKDAYYLMMVVFPLMLISVLFNYIVDSEASSQWITYGTFAILMYACVYVIQSYILSQYLSSQMSVAINSFVIMFYLFNFLEESFHDSIKYVFSYSTLTAMFKTSSLLGDDVYGSLSKIVQLEELSYAALFFIMIAQFFVSIGLLAAIQYLKYQYRTSQKSYDTSKLKYKNSDDLIQQKYAISDCDEETIPLIVDWIFKIYPNGVASLKDISFMVRKGEIFGLLGQNASGKSTTFDIITAGQSSTLGRVKYFGHPLNEANHTNYQNIGFCPQYDFLTDQLTVKEQLEYFCKIKKAKEEFLGEFIDYFDLPTDGTTIDKLSFAQRRKLCCIIAFIGDPKILFFDQPSVGLDSIFRQKLWKLIVQYKKRGSAIVITTHNIAEAEQFCDRIGILVKGELRYIDTPANYQKRFSRGYRLILHYKNLSEIAQIKERLLNDRDVFDCKDLSQKKKLVFDFPREKFNVKDMLKRLIQFKKTEMLEGFELFQDNLETIMKTIESIERDEILNAEVEDQP